MRDMQGPQWSARNQLDPDKVPWEEKFPKMFFRGTTYCPHLVSYLTP